MSLNERRSEFERHVWDHAADSFQAQFDERRALTSEEVELLEKVYRAAVDADEAAALAHLRELLVGDANALALILQLCGLTRNKILQDLRASASVREQGIRVPSTFQGLTGAEVWSAAGPYLLSRLRTVLSGLMLEGNTIGAVFEALNQSTWLGYIRQERAKRSGHEAEYRLATVLASLAIPFEPFEKADNPLCRDAQIDGISFDIVLPSVSEPLVVVKSTVHTANIGQYGESKDDLEVRQARSWIDENYSGGASPTLLAFIDGVGFRSNRAGLDGVLTQADEFCQFKTIWKAALIALQRLGLGFEIALSAELRDEFAPFIARWDAGGRVLSRESLVDVVGWVEAGDALIRRTDLPS